MRTVSQTALTVVTVLFIILLNCTSITHGYRWYHNNQSFMYSLNLEAHQEWYLGVAGSTNVSAVVTADLDDDGVIEIISVGYCADSTNLNYPVGEIKIWHYDGLNLNVLAEQHWQLHQNWETPTYAFDAAVADIDLDGTLEIITVGATQDGSGQSAPVYAQIRIWAYSAGTLTLELEDISTYGSLSAVCVADVDFDTEPEIIITDILAGIFVCEYAPGTIQINRTYWSSGNWFTAATDVYAVDIDNDNVVEIITAGYFADQNLSIFEVIFNGEVRVWNYLGGTFNLESSVSWTDNPGGSWTIGGNYVEGLAVVDANADGSIEIFTAGYRAVAGFTSIEPETEFICWQYTGWTLNRINEERWRTNNYDTYQNGITFGNIDTENDVELLTAGYYNDTSFDFGLINTFYYSTVFSQESEVWWNNIAPNLSSTTAYDICVRDIDSDAVPEIIVGGGVFKNSALNSQLTIWSVQNYPIPQNTISGTVRDNAYNPIGNATVSDGTRTVATLPDGTYTITNVPAGTYIVSASKTGYTSSSKTVTLSGSGNVVNVDFILHKQPLQNGNITGTVVDTMGNPVDGATIVVYYNATASQAKNTLTNTTGNYEISNLLPVKYDIECFKGGYYTVIKYGVTVPSASTIIVDFVLQAEDAVINGYITDAITGNGISGASITVNTVYSAVSQSDGYYRIDNVTAPATYTINVSATGYVSASRITSVSPGAITTENFQLTPISTTGSLEGYVKDANTSMPIENANIAIIGTSFTTSTDADGYYFISNIPEGTYNVEASANNYQSKTETVTIIAGQTVVQDFLLEPAEAPQPPTTGWLEGYVKDANTNNPIESANLELVNFGIASTDVIGYFNFSDVPEGDYELKVRATGYYDETRYVTINAGFVTKVDISLLPIPQPTTGWLEGYVRDANTNNPVESAYLELVNFGTTSTDLNGYFNFSNVPEGSYQLKISATGYYDETGYVTVVAGQVTRVDILLSPIPQPITGWLEGYVKDATTNNPIAGATVTIIGTVYSANTTTDGYYNISDIEPAIYTVKASAPDYEDLLQEAEIRAGEVCTLDFLLTPKMVVQPPKIGWVECTVLDVKTGDILPEVTIKVFKDGNVVKTVSTNENGFCNISLTIGTYIINISKEGYYDVEEEITVQSGQTYKITIYLKPEYEKKMDESMLWYGVAGVIGTVLFFIIVVSILVLRKRHRIK